RERWLVQPWLKLSVLKQGLDLGTEDELVLGEGEVERLDADAIAYQQQLSAAAIPESEGEHAAEVVDAVGSVFLVQVEDDLGVAPGPEAVALRLEGRAVLCVVVDLAVVDKPDGLVLVGH